MPILRASSQHENLLKISKHGCILKYSGMKFQLMNFGEQNLVYNICWLCKPNYLLDWDWALDSSNYKTVLLKTVKCKMRSNVSRTVSFYTKTNQRWWVAPFSSLKQSSSTIGYYLPVQSIHNLGECDTYNFPTFIFLFCLWCWVSNPESHTS